MLATEVRSKCAFVSGAAQSVEAAIATATRTLEILAAAVGNVAHPATEDAALAGRVEQMTQRIQTAAPELGQGTRQIEEIEVFITRVALHSNLQVLGTVVDAARDADAGNTFVIAAAETQALATQADHLTAAVLRHAGSIIVAAQQARAAMCHAEAVIHALDEAVGAIGEDVTRRKAALPATPQQRAAG
jgi:methyl-accepting chemotaxis protein